jgi:hypothetical protein
VDYWSENKHFRGPIYEHFYNVWFQWVLWFRREDY